MPRKPREQSELDLYHVVSRGVDKTAIFRDDSDRKYFLKLLNTKAELYNVEVWSYCLMGNHYHLAVNASYDNLPKLTHDLHSIYARYFNKKYDRVGHLFQGRYWSGAIKTAAQMMCVARYIHRNPLSAGISDSCSFEWSSYDAYLRGEKGAGALSCKDLLALFGSLPNFIQFHNEKADPIAPGKGYLPQRRRLDGDARIRIAEALDSLGEKTPELLARAICSLRRAGITVAQMLRYSNLSRHVIASATGSDVWMPSYVAG